MKSAVVGRVAPVGNVQGENERERGRKRERDRGGGHLEQ